MYRTGQRRCGRCLSGYLYSWFCFPSVSMFSLLRCLVHMALKRHEPLPGASFTHAQPKQGWGFSFKQQRTILTFLTRHLHNISRDDFSGLDHLHTLSVRTVDFAHLRLILLESLDGIFSVALLWLEKHSIGSIWVKVVNSNQNTQTWLGQVNMCTLMSINRPCQHVCLSLLECKLYFFWPWSAAGNVPSRLWVITQSWYTIYWWHMSRSSLRYECAQISLEMPYKLSFVFFLQSKIKCKKVWCKILN